MLSVNEVVESPTAVVVDTTMSLVAYNMSRIFWRMTVLVDVGSTTVYLLFFLFRPAAASLAKRFFPNFFLPIAALNAAGSLTPFRVNFLFSAAKRLPVPNLGLLLPATATS